MADGFSGVYIGGSASISTSGVSKIKPPVDIDSVASPAFVSMSGLGGLSGGGHIGFNYDFGNFIVGGRVGFETGGYSSFLSPYPYPNSLSGLGEVTPFALVQLGYQVVNNLMVYGSFGARASGLYNPFYSRVPYASSSSAQPANGFPSFVTGTLGLGAEYKFSDAFSVSGAFQFDVGSTSLFAGVASPSATAACCYGPSNGKIVVGFNFYPGAL